MIPPRQHLILALCCIGAAACGDRGSAKPQGGTAGAVAAPTCPDASLISTTIGFAVRSMPGASRSAPGTLLCA